MNAQEHIEEAEELLDEAETIGMDAEHRALLVASAQVHATLALASTQLPINVTITPPMSAPAASGVVDDILRAQKTVGRLPS